MTAAAFATAASPAVAAPACTATATNVVGAHAGSLSSRIGATVQCDQAVTIEFTLPGAARVTYPSDASGYWMGIAGDGYLCQRSSAVIGVLARAADGSTWLATVPILTEAGTPPATGFGPDCDVLIGPSLNFFTWGGPLVVVSDGLSAQTLGSPLPRSDNASTDPLDHIASVSSYDPQANAFVTWIPGAPAFANTLHVLMPGVTYVLKADADIPLTYPVSAP